MDSMNLMVCPHDTAGDPLKWFQFAFYLTKYCSVSTKHYKCFDFIEFHEMMSGADIIYANPQDSLELIETFNFVPLVRSVNLYDEVVFIANKEVKSNSIHAIDGQECISCNGMMVTKVGLKSLLDKQIRPAKIHSKTNWTAVVKAISQGEKSYGFVYKDFYDGLNSLTKNSVNKIGESEDKKIFHSFFINAKHQNRADYFTKLLAHTHKTEVGKLALKRVNIEKLIPVYPKDIIQFKNLLSFGSKFMK